MSDTGRLCLGLRHGDRIVIDDNIEIGINKKNIHRSEVVRLIITAPKDKKIKIQKEKDHVEDTRKA